MDDNAGRTMLEPGCLVAEWYVVVRRLDPTPSGVAYVARDPGSVMRLVHDIPLAGLPARGEEVRARFETLSCLEHPLLLPVRAVVPSREHLAVVHDHVEGVSLLRLGEMSLRRFPERQVLRWGLDLCDLLAYLHERPRPFVLGSLEPSAFVATADERLMLLDPGVAGDVAPEEAVARDLDGLGRLLAWMLTGDADGVELPNVSTEMATLVRRCRGVAGTTPLPGFEELRSELQRVAEGPRPQQEGASPLVGDDPRRFGFPKGLGIAAGATLLVLVVAASLVLARLFSDRPFHRQGPALFVVSRQHLVLLDPSTLAEKGRKEFPDASLSGVRHCRSLDLLVVADRRKGRLFFVDARSGAGLGTLGVDADPVNMVLLPDEPRLFCTHGASRGISEIALDKRRVKALFSMPAPPTGLAATPDGSLLYVSSGSQGAVHVLETRTGRIVRSVALDGVPGALALSRDRATLWACLPRTSEVLAIHLDAEGLPEASPPVRHPELGGSRPVAIDTAPGGRGMAVLCQASSSVSVISPDGTVARGADTAGIEPTCWTSAPDSTALWIGNQQTRSVVRLAQGRLDDPLRVILPHAPRDVLYVP